MLEHIIRTINEWTNANSGFVTLLIFLLTLVFGWISGIFRGLTNRPRLKIVVINGPSMSCTFDTGRTFNGCKTHRTAISLYLHVTNNGTAPTDIEEIHVGYHNYTFKNTFLWFWLTERMNALSDFHITLGDYIKVYPFLIQVNTLSSVKQDTYLPVGKSAGGIVYFEQSECWGGFKPRVKNGRVRLKVRIRDAFGHFHSRILTIPQVSLAEARLYNPEFGNSIEKSRTDHPTNEAITKQWAQARDQGNDSHVNGG